MSWRQRLRLALAHGAQTPFHLFAFEPLEARLRQLEGLKFGIPTKCWLSFKTQPMAPLVRWWVRSGRPVEVVSEFEYRAAFAEGCPPERLLANGPAKHRWLAGVSVPGLNVNFDSLNEIAALAPVARQQGWRTGLRIRTAAETDPEQKGCPTQFGIEPAEIPTAFRLLGRHALHPTVLHTHLRTNVPDPTFWVRAISELKSACESAGWAPEVLDLGGGLPSPGTFARGGGPLDAGFDPGLNSYCDHLRATLKTWVGVRELWLEHGRHLTASAGVLAIRVIDIKEHPSVRILICDGGRTLNAMVSLWEDHELQLLDPRRAKPTPTIVHGPTCMAFDQLGRRDLPRTIQVGDVLFWREAGAYHLPWETRFSHGLPAVWTVQGDAIRRARPAESWERYWGQWDSEA